MRVILVRHYKTVLNSEQRIMGWGDAPPAVDWEEDVAEVDAVLRERNIHFDAIYSSALERARQTALYYATKRGLVRVRSSESLNEINYGSLFQKTKQWVAEHLPEYKTDPDFVYPGGESFRQMQTRSLSYLLSLEPVHRHQSILLVTHAGVIRGLVSHFLGLDFGVNLKRRIPHGYIGDLQISADTSVSYDEWGKPSGFVKDGVIRTPYVADVEPGVCPTVPALLAKSSSSPDGRV